LHTWLPSKSEPFEPAGARMGLPDQDRGEARECSVSSLLRPNDIAQMLCVSRAWVYDAARKGRIPSVRLGGEDGPLRFVTEDIEQWLAETRAGRLTRRTGHPAGAAPDKCREHATDSSGPSVVPIRGQQSLL
jgi:excisionase family DNA binding protein